MVLSYNVTVAEAINQASAFLEQRGILNTPMHDIWQRVFDKTYTDHILSLRQNVSDQDIDKINAVLEALAQDQPIQYILGQTQVMGHTYYVDSSTLIPREETYGLVDIAQANFSKEAPLKILDIGTGSGFLAIELALAFPQAQVTGLDISSQALMMAKKNGDFHQVKVDWLMSDLFSAVNKEEKFDLIVSNPPYISYDEVDQMDASVIKYEPHQALFAQEDGYYFYRKICQEASAYLNENGLLLLEIGYRQGEKVAALCQQSFPQGQVEVKKDYNQLDRYVSVQLRK